MNFYNLFLTQFESSYMHFAANALNLQRLKEEGLFYHFTQAGFLAESQFNCLK